MEMNSLPRPTDAELNILRVLWKCGASTVRDICDELNRVKKTGYTTVLKFLQIMFEKGLVRRDESQRSHVYEAAWSEDETQKQLVDDLLEKAFGGSASKLVLQALDNERASDEDLEEIRKILARLEGERK